jgi:twitching motility protein PilT
MVRAMLAGSLQGVIAQLLLKKADGTGRVGAFEVLVGTGAVRNLIRENQIPQLYSMLQTGSRYGMITMEEAIKNLLEQGIIDPEAARLALLKTSDGEDEGGSGDHASGALGGAKIKKQTAANIKVTEEGYSF